MLLSQAVFHIQLTVACIILVYPSVTESRRYDVNNESVKLFGEELGAVLARFRRTPEYASILSDRLNALKRRYEHISQTTLFYFMGKLKEQVEEKLKPLTEQTTFAVARTAAYNVTYYRSQVHRRSDTNDSDPTSVERLEHYSHANTLLSASQKNVFKDMGFENAGNMIHSLIRNMGPADKDEWDGSTRLPFFTDSPSGSKTTTTEHALIHEVSTQSTITHHPELTSQTSPGTHTRFRAGARDIKLLPNII